MCRRHGMIIGACMLAIFYTSQIALAQQDDFSLIDGSIVFEDAESDSLCAAVNTFNADFFIRSCDRRLILTTGDDRLIPYVVDADYNVSHDSGVAAGRIRFATDHDGLRQVFWVSDDTFPEGPDFVVNYIAASDQLAVATVSGQGGEVIPLAPENISQTECDPAATFDGGTDLLCPRTCGLGAGSSALMMTLMWSLMNLSAFRRCRRTH